MNRKKRIIQLTMIEKTDQTAAPHAAPARSVRRHRARRHDPRRRRARGALAVGRQHCAGRTGIGARGASFSTASAGAWCSTRTGAPCCRGAHRLLDQAAEAARRCSPARTLAPLRLAASFTIGEYLLPDLIAQLEPDAPGEPGAADHRQHQRRDRGGGGP